MYNYELNEKAKEDLLRIYEYGIAKFGLNQADKYFDSIHDCFDKIASNPLMFPMAIRYRTAYRYCVCGVDPIFFKMNAHTIEIMAIIGRQNF